MGYYLEPQDVLPKRVSKLDYLEKNGQKISGPFWPTDDTLALVCLLDNGAWLAAGVCYCPEEMRAFSQPTDGRWRTWYLLPKEKVYAAMRPEDAASLRKLWGKARYEPRHP